MRFTFLTLFPNLIEGYFGDSILKNAIESRIIEVEIIDFRTFSAHKHKKVDDYQIGGGSGLVICADVLERAILSVRRENSHIIYLTPVAKRFEQNDARRIAQYEHVIFICGRYEGIDEHIVEEFVDEVFCIGDYIMTGGELGALVMCDCVARNIPNVLGNPESLNSESFENGLLQAPVFVKSHSAHKKIPYFSPSEYSKGNHYKISVFKRELSIRKTQYFRPDLYQRIKGKK